MKKLVERIVLGALNLNRNSFGHIDHVHLHSRPVNRKLFIADMFSPKRLKELFDFKLEIGATFSVPFNSVFVNTFVSKFSTDIVELHYLISRAFLNLLKR